MVFNEKPQQLNSKNGEQIEKGEKGSNWHKIKQKKHKKKLYKITLKNAQMQ